MLLPPILLLILAVAASLLWLLLVLALSVLAHEFGHALAAWASGMVVTSLGIGSGKPLLVVRLPAAGTLLYFCRLGLRFSGVTWTFSPKGEVSRWQEILLASGGSLVNAGIALVSAWALTAFETLQPPFLTVWMPTVTVLLVNSVLALSFFVPHRTRHPEQGTLPSDGLQMVSALYPAYALGGQYGRQSVRFTGSLRTLTQQRAFWESIGDTTMLCVALLRAADSYLRLGEREAALACWREASDLPLLAAVEGYRRAWSGLLAVRLGTAADPAVSLDLAEAEFRAVGDRSGVDRVTLERLTRLGNLPPADREVELAALQSRAGAPLLLSVLGARITLQATAAMEPDCASGESAARIELLVSRYDAARIAYPSPVTDVHVYEMVARVRAAAGDEGGAAIAYERALAASRRVFLALAFLPDVQERYAARQGPLIEAARLCCLRLGRSADAERYARLFPARG
ncbi:MAG: M50 family metallopeptidase [Cytophagales bacterium]|nr:M50 family metallopeptidase [Armatimonadota bacterium]